MKRCKYISLLTLQFLLCTVCFAQKEQLTFNRVPGKLFSTGAGVQDSLGYMWLAYWGLHRYDGYNYTSYFNDPLNPRSLAGNRIEALCAGRNVFIWVGTYGYGLDRLNPATGIFEHFRHNSKNEASLSNDTVTAILEDHEGVIWVGTLSGLNRLDPKNKTFTRYQHSTADTTTLSHNEVRALYEDPHGTLWVGTGTSWGNNPTKSGGLNRLDRTKGTFTRYLHDTKNPKSLIDNRVRAIFEDSRGIFWVGTAGDGLHTMDRAKGSFERHRYDPAHPEGLSRPPQKKNSVGADDHITFIIEDVTGAIWIGTFGNGINRYDPKTKKIRHFPPFKDKLSGVQQDYAWWTCASRDGILWIGYKKDGYYRIDPLRRSISHFATGNTCFAIHEDASGVLWYGDHPGLVRKDSNKGTEQRFVHDPGNPLSLSNNNVSAIYEDRQAVLWIGTQDGLNRFERKTGAFARYLSNPHDDSSITIGEIKSIYEDRQGNLWIGSDGGLNRMNRETGTFTHYPNDPKDSNSLSNNRISRIYEDRSGNLWIGTYQGGLNRLTPQTGKTERFLYGIYVFSLLEDSEGVLWVGTSNGLYRSNLTMNSFSLFWDPGSEMPRDIVISGVLEDDHKALWINSSIGILKLNPQRNEIFIYGENHGVTQSFSAFSGYYMGKSGELFFGCHTGYNAFFPEQLTGNTKPPQIVMNEFRLADQPVMPGKGSPLRAPLSQTKEIRLKHNQNIFSFDFAGIHYSSPEHNRHLYTLEGLDNNWRKAGEEKTAYYYNVPPGRYIFHVKAANSDGVWAEKTIAVIIIPPWWSTWWAYILYTLLLAGFIYALVQYRINKIHMQHEIALQKHKATEQEMQALRAQMNPHFIFNSLNSINRFILQNNKAQASEYLTKFSKLVRMILQNSQASFIPLESELESLKLYLELEAVRFDHHFEFKITVDDELDTDIIKVPPLIIQPYTENAIWHGLMHKEEKGHLEIEVLQEKDQLFFRIADDGIGRKQAAAMASKSATRHKSMGLRITADRIAMLQSSNGTESPVTINDLVNADGSAAGTEVIIKIPVLYS